jgi:hypothetical protein
VLIEPIGIFVRLVPYEPASIAVCFRARDAAFPILHARAVNNKFFDRVTKQQIITCGTIASVRSGAPFGRRIGLAPPHHKLFPCATRLCRRHRRRSQPYAADFLSITVLENPEAAAVAHNQIEVASPIF